MRERYERAMHAMQAAVAAITRHRLASAYPHPELERELKHHRVGLNSAMSSQGALAALLIEKGVFTEEEYVAKQTEFAELEAESNAKLAIKECRLPPDTKFA